MAKADTPLSPAGAPSPEPPEAAVVVPHHTTILQRLAAWLVFIFIKSVTATLRYRIHDRSGFFEDPPAGQAIYCAWHNRLALCMKMYFSYVRPYCSSKGMAAMVSASRDGALLAAILEAFRVQPVRGSTSRRGPQALLELARWAERGYDLAITPDGPRGPRYVVQPGVMSLAQITGLPAVPFSYRLGWKIQANSWDRFQIPLPFSRCDVYTGKPVWVPRDASEEERERLRQELEQTLKSISED